MTDPERIRPVLPPPPIARPVLVASGVPVDDAEAIAAEHQQMRRDEWRSLVPDRFREAVVGDVPAEIRADLELWIAHDDPPNLLLLGDVGVGKTHSAIAACRARFGAGRSTFEFAPVGEMLDRLDWRRPGSEAALDLFCTVGVLLCDDLGTERSNEWTGERLYAILNRRWLERRPTVATSNLSPADLEAAIGTRSYSRLADGAIALRQTGPDRRRLDG